MTNIHNIGISVGRLVRDPQFFDNKDGSKKVLMTVAVQRNFRNAEGKKDTDFIPLEGFIPAANVKAGNSVYNLIHKGDKITVEYTVRSSVYTDKNGNPKYGTALSIQNVTLEESKMTTDKRMADRAATDAAKTSAYVAENGVGVNTAPDGATVVTNTGAPAAPDGSDPF